MNSGNVACSFGVSFRRHERVKITDKASPKSLRMISRKRVKSVAVVCKNSIALIFSLLLVAGVDAGAQSRQSKKSAPPPKAPTKSEQKEIANNLAKTRGELVDSAKEYKKSLEKLLVFYENNVKQATERRDKLKALQAEGLVSKRDLEGSEKAIEDAKAKVEEVHAQMKSADRLIEDTLEEAKLAEQLAKAPPLRPGKLLTTTAYVRYAGTTSFTLYANAANVQSFFMSKFGRALPVSAFGQTPVHDRLGLDHRNSMDVGVNPNSAEGQALINYLRSAGIPFIAFTQAVPGAATGPHIHIGRPSHRF